MAAADEQVRQVIAADPVNAEALMLRANIVSGWGDRPGAVAILKNLVRLNPAHAEAHAALGQHLHGLGEWRDAEGHLRDAIRLQPKLSRAHLHLGDLLAEQARLADAEKAYRTTLRLKPGMPEALGNLSLVQSLLGEAEEAVKSARAAIKAAPKNASAHSRLAMALDNIGQVDQAIAAHEKAIRLAPANPQLRLDLASTLAAHGRIDEAMAANRAILKSFPNHAGAYAQIARYKKFEDRYDPDFQALEDLAARPAPSAPELKAVKFALGKAYEDVGEHEAGFHTLLEANRIERQSFRYRPEMSEKLFADIKAAYAQPQFGKLPTADHQARPIFIVGMPRSGTSLTEQIIAAHPAVSGVGELASINTIAAELTALAPEHTHQSALGKLDRAQLGQWGKKYLRHAAAFAGNDRRTVDKMPSNFLYLGLIRLIFPHAVFVHCRRDPADTCLSIFKTSFAHGNLPYAYDLDELAHVYALYQDLMAHWRRLSGAEIYELDYERLVAEGPAEMRRLIDHCGLDWHDDILDFHAMAQPTRTASIAQVRKPLNAGSVGIARRYGAAAGPLFEALERAGVQ